MSDFIDNEVILDRLRAWGNPFHGKIVNGTLTLPNAETQTWPATQNNNCFVFRVPGAPGGNGADAPPGGEWRDYLLLYGNCQAVYSKQVSTSLVNWLYVRPDGSRWLIKLTSNAVGIATSSAALVMSFSASRFGEFSKDLLESFSFDLTLPDRGLDPALAGLYSGKIPASVNIGISDMTEDGSKCCLMFWQEKTGWPDQENQQYPYGFFEVSLDTSVFSLSTVALVYDLGDVYGTETAAFYDFEVEQPDPLYGCYNSTWTNIPTGPRLARDDSVVAAWYINGVLTPVLFNDEQLTESDSGIYKNSPSSGWWQGFGCPDCNYRSETKFGQYTATVGAVGVAEIAIVSDATYTIQGEQCREGDNYGDHSWTQNMSLNGVEVYTNSDGEDLVVSPTFPGIDGTYKGYINTIYPTINPGYTDEFDVFHPAPQPLTFSGTVHKWDSLEEVMSNNGRDEAPSLFIKRFSSTLLGYGRAWKSLTTGEKMIVIDKFLTKQGLVTNTVAIPPGTDLGQISATLQPVTGEIEIGFDGLPRSFV